MRPRGCVHRDRARLRRARAHEARWAAPDARLPRPRHGGPPVDRRRRARRCSSSAAATATCSRRSRRPRASASTSAPAWSSSRARAIPGSRSSVGAGEDVELGQTFDYIVLSDVLPFVDDLHALFRTVARHSHRETRIVDQLLQPALAAGAARARAAPPEAAQAGAQLGRRPSDVENLLRLAGLESVTTTRRILLPLRIPFVSAFFNGFLANLWIIRAPLPHVLDRRARRGRPTSGGASASRSSCPRGTRPG